VFARRESYAAQVPDGVGALVAAVDVQADRLEYQVKGFGAGEESWLVEWGQIVVSVERPGDAWLELDRKLQQYWEHASGRKLRIECVTVDSGFKADDVYKFCKPRASRKVFATKGSTEKGKPIVGRPTSNNAFRTRLYMLCTDTGKDTVYERLRIAAPGPGYMHLPYEIDREYVDQLTAEKVIRKFVKGRAPQRMYVKIRERNEALDLEVGSLAALRILLGPQPGRALIQRAARLAIRRDPPATVQAGSPAPLTPSDPPRVPPAVARRTLPSRPRRGWVQGWRK
jgi:phage terminase large subunit GpA-like protein